MRIGVVSDTHNNLRNVGLLVDIFNRIGVDRVIHTGDITQAKTLEVLSELRMPLSGVFGNNDLERCQLEEACQRHSFSIVDPPLKLNWAGRRVLVVHDPLDIPDDRVDLVLHGHNHRTILERSDDRLVFNPGECAGHMTGQNTIGVVDLPTLAVTLEHF